MVGHLNCRNGTRRATTTGTTGSSGLKPPRGLGRGGNRSPFIPSFRRHNELRSALLSARSLLSPFFVAAEQPSLTLLEALRRQQTLKQELLTAKIETRWVRALRRRGLVRHRAVIKEMRTQRLKIEVRSNSIYLLAV